MTAVVASIDLPAPPADVWAIVLDPQQLQRWVTIHRKLTSADEGPPRAGFRMSQRLAIRGAPVSVSWELEECRPPELARWTGRGPARSTALIEYRLREIEGGTRFDYTNDFTPPMGALGLVASAALMGDAPQREARASLERLKEIVAGP